jgi:hypothetical protein
VSERDRGEAETQNRIITHNAQHQQQKKNQTKAKQN